MLFLPSLEIKAPRYLKWSLCLSLMPLIVMLMSGGSSLRLITITSVFLLFSSSPFSLLFDSTMFRSCCRSFSFSEIRTVSSAYLRLFMLCPQKIKRGVRQGCVLSPDLFSLYSEIIMRNIEEQPGIRVGGHNINNLRYAFIGTGMEFSLQKKTWTFSAKYVNQPIFFKSRRGIQ